MTRFRPLFLPALGTLLSLCLIYASMLLPPSMAEAVSSLMFVPGLLLQICPLWFLYSLYRVVGPYTFGVILSSMTLLGSGFGALFVYIYRTREGDTSIAFALSLMATVPALVMGLVAAVLFFRVRRERPERPLARAFWLPVCPPVLLAAVLALAKR